MVDLNKLLLGTAQNGSGIFILVSHKTAADKVTKRLNNLLPFHQVPHSHHHTHVRVPISPQVFVVCHIRFRSQREKLGQYYVIN